jgi:hypothetical protein
MRYYHRTYYVNNEENREFIRQIYFSVLFPQTDGEWGNTATPHTKPEYLKINRNNVSRRGTH